MKNYKNKGLEEKLNEISEKFTKLIKNGELQKEQILE